MAITNYRKLVLKLLVVLAIFLGFGFYTFKTSQQVGKSVTDLAENKIPGLVAAGNLKRAFQGQTISLYELYATVDFNAYERTLLSNASTILIETSNLQTLPTYKKVANNFEHKIQEQNTIASEFTKTMSQQDVDWDKARNYLKKYSDGANLLEHQLDMLVADVSLETRSESVKFKQSLSVAFNVGLVFMSFLVLTLVLILLQLRSDQQDLN